MPPVGWELAPGVIQKKPADDIELGSPGDQVYTSSVQLPQGWSLFPPQGTDLVEDWAEYHSKYSFKDGKFIAERRLITKKDKIPLEQWDKYLAFRRGIFQDEAHMTPLSLPGMPMASADSFGEFGFDPFARLNMTDQERSDIVQPLVDATKILDGDKAPEAADLTKAHDLAEKAAGALEPRTLSLAVDDIHSLYWSQLLSIEWETKGRVALEMHDLPAAETYLKAAWHLGQNRQACYQLGRLYEAKQDETAAAHTYRLCKSTTIMSPLISGAQFMPLDKKIADRYRALTGKDVNSAAVRLPGGAYASSPVAELDKENEFRQILHTSKVTGSGMFALSFEPGKPAQVRFLGGDNSIKGFEPAIRAFNYHPFFPAGSKARILREMQLVCTPYAGCDGYMKLPNSIQAPAVELRPIIKPQEKDGVVQIKLAPPQ